MSPRAMPSLSSAPPAPANPPSCASSPASLDVPFRADFHRELPLLRRRLNITMVHVTHDPVEVLALGRLLAVLDRGRLCQAGTVAGVAGGPRHRFAAQLLGWPPRNWL